MPTVPPGMVVDAPDSGSAARAQLAAGASADSQSTPVLKHRRGFVPGVLRAGRNFASDFGYVASAPARMHVRDVLLVAGVLGGTAVLYANDQVLLDGVQRSLDDPVYKVVVAPGRVIQPVGMMENMLGWYVGGLLVGHAFHLSTLEQISLEILESHAIAGAFRNAVKNVVGRAQPYKDLGPRHFEPGHKGAFPSGHTSIYFELATILSHHARSTPVTVGLYALAASGTLERVDSRAHWPSDLAVSAAMGLAVAQTVVQRQDARIAKERPTLGVVPLDGGVMLVVQRQFR